MIKSDKYIMLSINSNILNATSFIYSIYFSSYPPVKYLFINEDIRGLRYLKAVVYTPAPHTMGYDSLPRIGQPSAQCSALRQGVSRVILPQRRVAMGTWGRHCRAVGCCVCLLLCTCFGTGFGNGVWRAAIRYGKINLNYFGINHFFDQLLSSSCLFQIIWR